MHRARTSRVEHMASVLLAVALGAIFAAALIHWIDLESVNAERTAAATAGLLALPGQWLRRYWAWARHRVRLDTERRQLKWIEEDIQHMESELAFLPQHIRYLRGEAARMRVCIAVAERQGPQLPPAHTEPQP
jgi:hypothetical protein